MKFWAVQVAVLMACGLSLCAATFDFQKWGPCPSLPTQGEVDINKTAGLWYEYARFYNPIEGGTECQHINISMESDQQFKIGIKSFDQGRNETKAKEGHGYRDSKDHGTFHIKFYRFLPSTSYHVVSTDYSNFVLAWRCFDLKLFHFEMAWLLSRKPGTLDIKTKARVYAMLQQHKVDPTQFQQVLQDKCPY